MNAPAEPEIEAAAHATAADVKAHAKISGLRRIKYRLILIFLLLPGLLVSAIVFDWLWSQNLSAHLTRPAIIGIYAGLVVVFGALSVLVGYFVRKRMRREEDEAIAAAKAAAHVGLTTKAVTSAHRRSRH
jgi:hypothetical protein